MRAASAGDDVPILDAGAQHSASRLRTCVASAQMFAHACMPQTLRLLPNITRATLKQVQEQGRWVLGLHSSASSTSLAWTSRLQCSQRQNASIAIRKWCATHCCSSCCRRCAAADEDGGDKERSRKRGGKASEFQCELQLLTPTSHVSTRRSVVTSMIAR